MQTNGDVLQEFPPSFRDLDFGYILHDLPVLVIYYTTYLYWLYITRLIYLDVDKCREGVWTWLTGSLINEGCQDRVVRKLWIVMDASTIIFRYSQCQAYET